MNFLIFVICFLSFLSISSSNKVQKLHKHLKNDQIPLFLAVTDTNYNEDKRKVFDFILEEISFFPNSASLFSEKPKEFFTSHYIYPPSFHITTLYIGANETKLETPYYTEFKENEEFVISIDAILIVPGKIVTGITFPDRNRILIENRFPHVTLLLGEWSAVDSNGVMQALFDENGPLNQYYSTDFFQSVQPFYDSYNLNVNLESGEIENVNVIVLKFAPSLKLDAITMKIYNELKK